MGYFLIFFKICKLTNKYTCSFVHFNVNIYRNNALYMYVFVGEIALLLHANHLLNSIIYVFTFH